VKNIVRRKLRFVHALRRVARVALHHVRVDGIGGQAECGQTVSDKINPQQVNRQERCRKTHDHADGHEQKFPGVACQQVLERFADVAVNAPASSTAATIVAKLSSVMIMSAAAW